MGHNMYAYCRNNPVCRIDSMGYADEEPFDEDTGDVDATPDIEGGASLGTNPVSPTVSPASPNQSQTVPQKAWDVLNYLKTHNWHPMSNYKGGREYANDGRDGSQVLPSNGNTYWEFDINPKIKGVDRGGERIVTDKSGSTWYTSNHYQTFIQMEGP